MDRVEHGETVSSAPRDQSAPGLCGFGPVLGHIPFSVVLASLALPYHAPHRTDPGLGHSLFLACYPPFGFINTPTPTSFCAAIAAPFRNPNERNLLRHSRDFQCSRQGSALTDCYLGYPPTPGPSSGAHSAARPSREARRAHVHGPAHRISNAQFHNRLPRDPRLIGNPIPRFCRVGYCNIYALNWRRPSNIIRQHPRE